MDRTSIIKDDNGMYHIIKCKDFRYYITLCGINIHDDTEPKPYINNKHQICPTCKPMAKIAKAHT